MCKFLIELEVMWVALIAYKPDLILVVDHLLIILIQLGVNMEYNDKDLVEQLAFVDLLLGQEVLFPHHHQPRKFDFSKISLVIAEYHQQVHQYHVKEQKFIFPSIDQGIEYSVSKHLSVIFQLLSGGKILKEHIFKPVHNLRLDINDVECISGK